MNNEEKLLLKICQCYFSNEQLIAPENINWKYFYKLSKSHNLVAISHCVINEAKLDIPKDIQELFLNSFLDQLYLANNQAQEIENIANALKDKKIKFIFFKGASLKKLYPIEEARTMGDIDILIDIKDRPAVKQALLNIGYSCEFDNGAVHNYTKGMVLLEVHTQIITEFGDDAFQDCFSNAQFDDCYGQLNNEYHFAYLIAHIAHHFKFYGAGVKMILDLAFMLKSSNIKLQRVLEILEPIGLGVFAKEMLTLCYNWFGVGRAYNRDTSKTEEYLIDGGAFGNLQENTSAINTRRGIEAGGSSKSPFMAKLRLAFPSYSQMKNIPYIKFIDGHPCLVPYAWCYRLIYNLKNRKEFMLKTVKGIDKAAIEQAEEQLKYFEDIGL